MNAGRRPRRTVRLPRSPSDRAARDVDDEVRFHLEMRAEELMRGGLSAEDARAQARREFGDSPSTRARLMRESARTQRRLGFTELVGELWQDFRYGCRKLVSAPAFTAVAVVTVGLAVGGTTAIYSVVRHVLLAPLGFPAPERLVAIWPELRLSPLLFDAMRDSASEYHLAAYQSAAAWSHFTISLTGDGEPERLMSVRATADFFRTLGAAPALGRTFAPDEDHPSRGAVAVLSHGLWTRRFGADSAIIGTTVTLEGRPHVVIGVMPEGFAFPHDADLWLPYERSPERADYRAGFLRVIGRLRPGVSIEQARAELGTMVDRLHANYPTLDPAFGRDATVVGLRERLVGDFRAPLLFLLGAVASVLLLASTNIASLLFGRAISRRREMAVRVALGAGRARLLRQLLVEAIPLALLGGVVGILLAIPGTALLVHHLPAGVPRLSEVSMDVGVLAFAGAATVGVIVLVGLLPAVVARHRLGGTLREARGESVAVGQLRNALVIAEVTIGVVVLLAGGLFLKSLYRLRHVDPGFESTGVLTLSLSPPRAVYGGQRERTVRLYDQLLADVAAIPGVEHVGIVQVLPMAGTNRRGAVEIENAAPVSGEATPWAEYRVVSGGYFSTLGIPLRRGRTFTRSDAAGAPAIVMVNDQFARAHWPGADPIGKRIRIPLWGGETWYAVIGVVGDVRHEGPAQPALPEVYVSYRQNPDPFSFVVLRTTLSDPTVLAPTVRERVWRLDPTIAVASARPLDDVLSDTMAQPRLLAMLLTVFGTVGLAIAAIGIYGVMAFFVAQRSREIGVRVALGARRPEVAWLVLRRVLALTGIGVGLGIGGGLVLQGVVRGLLFQVHPNDPWTAVTVGAEVLLTGVAASALPILRAIRVQPARALREE